MWYRGFSCMQVCELHTSSAHGGRFSETGLTDANNSRMVGTVSGCPAKAVSALDCYDISPTLLLHFYYFSYICIASNTFCCNGLYLVLLRHFLICSPSTLPFPTMLYAYFHQILSFPQAPLIVPMTSIVLPFHFTLPSSIFLWPHDPPLSFMTYL